MNSDDILNKVLEKLGDKYTYGKPLGQGASSRVYLLYHKTFGQVALKIMDYQYILDSIEKGSFSDTREEFIKKKKRFINEAKLYKKIVHANVARVYDVDSVKDKIRNIDIPYIIIQYVDGQPLGRLLKRKKPLDLKQAVAAAKDILAALEAIHKKGIVHRDLKPGNIMIEKETGKAILIDFGLAKDMVEGTRMTSTGLAMGTPLYMSPEQFKDAGKAGPAADIYSFGIIVYEMLTGSPPYKGNEAQVMCGHLSGDIPDIRKHNPKLPGEIDDVIRESMEKDKESRKTGVQYYREKLDSIFDRPGKAKVDVEPVKSPPQKTGIKRQWIYAAASLVVLLCAYILFILISPGVPGIPPEEKEQKKVMNIRIPENEEHSNSGSGKPFKREDRGGVKKPEGQDSEKSESGDKPVDQPDDKPAQTGQEPESTKSAPPDQDKKTDDPSRFEKPAEKDEIGVKKSEKGKMNDSVLYFSIKPVKTYRPGNKQDIEKELKETVTNDSTIDFSQFKVNEKSSAMYQPDPIYYNSKRDELLNVSGAEMKTLRFPWIVACAREGAPLYREKDSKKAKYKAFFLQRFEVLDKHGKVLLVRELDTKKRRNYRVNIQDFIYLSRALIDRGTSAYQKAVFTHMESYLQPGNIGSVTFYKSPSDSISQKIETRKMGTLRLAYVYAWQKNSYEDSLFVLIGNYPNIEGIRIDNKAFEKIIYGWCKVTNLFLWNSRIALITNPEAKFPSYIFTNGPKLKRFYIGARNSSIPDAKDLLVLEPNKMWEKSNWPFFLSRKFEGEYLGLVCPVGDIYLGASGLKLSQLKKEMETLKYDANNLDIVFLIDATTSMRPYIQGVSDIVMQLMEKLKRNSGIQTLRFGAAVYRDYVDRHKAFEIEPFPSKGNEEDISRLKNWLYEMSFNAASNPDDRGEAAYTEALFNGIYKAVRQSGFGKYNSKFLIVIGDTGNHSRGRDTHTISSIGQLLANDRVNCMMVQVSHLLSGGYAERRAIDLFINDARGIRDNYISRCFKIAEENSYNFSEKAISKSFAICRVDSPDMLKESLVEGYSERILDIVNIMTEEYQRLIDGEAIVNTSTKGTKSGVSIGPFVFENLRLRFREGFPGVLKDLKKERAYFMKFGYAKEFDPRSPEIPQFKNIYLFRKSELNKTLQVLDRTLRNMTTSIVGSLWKEMIHGIYGDEYEPGKTFNDYSKMHDGITYTNLSILFGKTQVEISNLKRKEFEEIERKIIKVKKRLENLFSYEMNERFFGPMDDPYIWLYEDEML